MAGAIVKPHFIGIGEKVRGLQFEGTANETKGPELEKARRLYLAKYKTAENIPLEQLTDPNWIAVFYVLKPKTIILFDEVNFPNDPRQELKL